MRHHAQAGDVRQGGAARIGQGRTVQQPPPRQQFKHAQPIITATGQHKGPVRQHRHLKRRNGLEPGGKVIVDLISDPQGPGTIQRHHRNRPGASRPDERVRLPGHAGGCQRRWCGYLQSVGRSHAVHLVRATIAAQSKADQPRPFG